MKGKGNTGLNMTRNLLSFSRPQRRAIVLFGLLAIAVLVISKVSIFRSASMQDEPFVAINVETTLKVRDSIHSSTYRQNNYKHKQSSYTHAPVHSSHTHTQTSFTTGNLEKFDPNTVSLDQLLAFGLREKAALNIIHYREKGGRFRKPEDLKKLYSLTREEMEVLIPYANIIPDQNPKPFIDDVPPSSDIAAGNTANFDKPKSTSKLIVDVNVADSLTWTLLPGIGAKRASAIINFRSKLGGFASVEQVAETFGLPDSIFQVIKPNLVWESSTMQQLSLNDCTETQLKSHPYITWQLAKLIVAYRNQHGPYQKVEDLLKIHAVQKDWLEKVKPYLKVGDASSMIAKN